METQYKEEQWECAYCGKLVGKYSTFHIGRYLEQVDSGSIAYYCRECFYAKCTGYYLDMTGEID